MNNCGNCYYADREIEHFPCCVCLENAVFNGKTNTYFCTVDNGRLAFKEYLDYLFSKGASQY